MDKTETKIVYAYDATGLYIGDKVLDCTGTCKLHRNSPRNQSRI